MHSNTSKAKTAPGAANTEGGYKGSKLAEPTALPY